MKKTSKDIIPFLRKSNPEEAEKIAESIVADAESRLSEVVGFGEKPETRTELFKEFGDMEAPAETEAAEKLLKYKVASTDTVFYPNIDGEVEAFAFDPYTLETLGKKLEGVPLVIGDNGHDAELPYAYFVDKYEVVDETLESGKAVKSLYQWAKLREDEDAPINFDALVQNPDWDVNGGDRKFAGSLKFSSKDVPYFYESGAKINYMTSPVPTHFAGVDIPVMEGAGLVEKTFGESKGDTMTDNVEAKTVEAQAAAPEVDVAAAIKEQLSGMDLATMVQDSVVAEIVKNVTAGLGETDKVAAADFEAIKAERDALLAEKAEAELTGLQDKIVAKALGAEATEEEATAFVEENLKEFGKAELQGYLAGLVAKGAEKTEETATKTFGKGKVDMTGTQKRKFPKVQI